VQGANAAHVADSTSSVLWLAAATGIDSFLHKNPAEKPRRKPKTELDHERRVSAVGGFTGKRGTPKRASLTLLSKEHKALAKAQAKRK
jgi:hypothetical protein